MKEYNAHYVIHTDLVTNETKETWFKDFNDFLNFRTECDNNNTLKGSYFFGDMSYFHDSTGTTVPEISANVP